MCFSKSPVGFAESTLCVSHCGPSVVVPPACFLCLQVWSQTDSFDSIKRNLEALMEDTGFASSVGGRSETPTSPHVISFKGRPGTHSDRGDHMDPKCARLGPSLGSMTGSRG